MSEVPKKRKEVIYCLSRASRCYGCDTKLVPDTLVKLQNHEDEREVLCMRCAGLDHLQPVLSGNASLTRLAGKYSSVQYNIMKWSELWKCYERKGILVEPQAVTRAASETAKKD